VRKLLRKANKLRTIDDLIQYGLIPEQEKQQYSEILREFSMQLTPAIVELMLTEDATGQIRRQFLPDLQELVTVPSELADPTGDQKYEVVKGVVHRYPDRCLLKVVNVCPVYCRFCFRKQLIGPGKASMGPAELQAAYDYIASQAGIWEVILTGGDPLFLKPAKLAEVIAQLTDIAHVEVIRIHTRVPVVDPSRVNQALIDACKSSKAVFIAIHANHPKEFTKQAQAACARLVAAGIPLLSQSVLLKGVNDDIATLKELMQTFVKNRIKPYYLHHPDAARGTSHFRVTVAKGQQLLREMQKISGLCRPTYMLEIPGGLGKQTINPSYLTKGDHAWQVMDHEGNVHEYTE
jgi:lysine 2,3-aminomutase